MYLLCVVHKKERERRWGKGEEREEEKGGEGKRRKGGQEEGEIEKTYSGHSYHEFDYKVLEALHDTSDMLLITEH